MKTLTTILTVLILTSVTHSQWSWIVGINVESFAVSGNNMFAATGNNIGIYLSTNYGSNWFRPDPMFNQQVKALAVSSNKVFAGVYNLGVFVTTNNGTNWIVTSFNNRTVWSLAVNGNYVFAGTESNGVYLSTNNGMNWTQTSLSNRTIRSLLVNGNYVFAGSSSGINNGLFVSTDNGITWNLTSLNDRSIYSLSANGSTIFAGTDNGLYVSTNNGSTWSQTSINTGSVYALKVNANKIYAAHEYLGVYFSTDNGVTWIPANEGLFNRTVRCFCTFNNFLFAGVFSYGIYSRPLGQFVGITPLSSEIPDNFTLTQNYPNPFNPSTKISFSIPKSSFVKMTVYDVTGKEVEILVNENMKAGSFEVDFNASKLTSGVYFCRITAEGFTDVKKMMLIK